MPCVGAVLSVVHLSIFRSGKGRIKDATIQLYQSLKGCSALCLCRTFLDYTEGDAAKHGDDNLRKKILISLHCVSAPTIIPVLFVLMNDSTYQHVWFTIKC